MEKIGFDSKKYLELQTAEIEKRIKANNNKLYLEFGGKIFDDLHASRVLPGFESDVKIQLLKKLKDISEIILVISAQSIEKSKIREDIGITYDEEVLRLIDNLRNEGLTVTAVVITMFSGQNTAKMFGNKLERRNEKVYFHNFITGYPNDLDKIVSENGYGSNHFIKTTKPLVIVSAPGPSNGKLATCLSQLYHEYKHGNKAGYAKYETFPVWNLPLKHPINIAYEAATADLGDVNMIDPFHLNSYKKIAINYNRDISAFPVLKNILSKITKTGSPYNSPTDMGVNMIGSAITNDKIVQEASKQEIIRRLYTAKKDFVKGKVDESVPNRIAGLINEIEIDIKSRKVIDVALKKAKETNSPAFALEIDGTFITGRTKNLISAGTACIINCLKFLSKINDEIDLIPPTILEPILELNRENLHIKNGILNLKEVLIALSVSATINPMAKKALTYLPMLKGTQAHSTFILNSADEEIFKKLGINVTSEPVFATANLFEN